MSLGVCIHMCVSVCIGPLTINLSLCGKFPAGHVYTSGYDDHHCPYR